MKGIAHGTNHGGPAWRVRKWCVGYLPLEFAIVNTPGLEAADGDLLLKAIYWYADRNVDFTDAFNAAWLLARGLTTGYTFDQTHFSRLEGIRVQVPGE